MTFWHYFGLSCAVFCTDATASPWFRLGWAVAWAGVTIHLSNAPRQVAP